MAQYTTNLRNFNTVETAENFNLTTHLHLKVYKSLILLKVFSGYEHCHSLQLIDFVRGQFNIG
jgi:hypothetical protein